MPCSVVFAISAHGFGHIAQVAPVAEALHRRSPDTRILIASTIPSALLSDFLACPFQTIYSEQDPGVVMRGPLHVDAEHTYSVYQRWHDQYEAHVRRLGQLLERYRPAIVISDIGYTILDAARRADVPALAFSSLNWADIVAPYCGHYPGMQAIHTQMIKAYNAASGFLQIEPAMPMPQMAYVRSVGPVARRGCRRREELLRHLGLPAETQLVLFSLGGIAAELTVQGWSIPAASHWVVPDSCAVDDPRFTRLRDTHMPYIDVLASADVLVTKPGYGNFTEAVCNRVAVIYTRRGHWPEEPALVDWLHRWGNAVELNRAEFVKGSFVAAFAHLATLPVKSAMEPVGIDQAVDIIMEVSGIAA